MPKVSIVMPVYNGERFVGEAINSVLAQTLTDWELVVTDDGSTDQTPNILKAYADSRITIIRQQNSGSACARNRALDAAAGDFVAFLDADDMYLREGLADMACFLESHSQFDVVYSDGIMCDQDQRPLMHLSEIRPGNYEGNILEQVVLWNQITVPVCTMMRRHVIEQRTLRFDPDLSNLEDWDFWIRLATFAHFGYLDKDTCLYRIHSTNKTKTARAVHRRSNHIQMHLKAMNSDWFDVLSEDTRRRFFSDLLVHLLGHDPEQQSAILQAAAFQALPATIQSELLRLTAGHHLILQQNATFAVDCLRRSLALNPLNQKSRLLLVLASRSTLLTVVVLTAWQTVHRTQVGIRRLGRRQPKSVPRTLLPSAAAGEGL